MTPVPPVRIMPSRPRFETLPAAAAPSQGWPGSSWIHRQRNEQASERHSKDRFRQPFHSNESNEPGASNSHRSYSVFPNGWLFRTRDYPHFYRVLRRGRRARPARRNRAGQRPRPDAIQDLSRRRPFDRGRRRSSDPHRFLLRNPSTLQMRKRQNLVVAHLSLRSTWRARNSLGKY